MTPWTEAGQAPLALEFLSQEYWSGLPFLPPGDLPNPGIESASLISLVLALEGRFCHLEFVEGCFQKVLFLLLHIYLLMFSLSLEKK